MQAHEGPAPTTKMSCSLDSYPKPEKVTKSNINSAYNPMICWEQNIKTKADKEDSA